MRIAKYLFDIIPQTICVPHITACTDRNINFNVIFGGVNIKQQREQLKEKPPSVIVATPGRCKALAKDGDISLKQCGHFILDECDKMLEQLDMRADVQEIFNCTLYTSPSPRDRTRPRMPSSA